MLKEYFIRYKFTNKTKLGMTKVETQGKVKFAETGFDAVTILKEEEDDKDNNVKEIIDVKLLEN